jgi:hypothetical protein
MRTGDTVPVVTAGYRPNARATISGNSSLPLRVAMRSGPLGHDDVRADGAQRVRPAGRVLEEERLMCAGDEVRAGSDPGIFAGGR